MIYRLEIWYKSLMSEFYQNRWGPTVSFSTFRVLWGDIISSPSAETISKKIWNLNWSVFLNALPHINLIKKITKCEGDGQIDLGWNAPYTREKLGVVHARGGPLMTFIHTRPGAGASNFSLPSRASYLPFLSLSCVRSLTGAWVQRLDMWKASGQYAISCERTYGHEPFAMCISKQVLNSRRRDEIIYTIRYDIKVAIYPALYWELRWTSEIKRTIINEKLKFSKCFNILNAVEFF